MADFKSAYEIVMKIEGGYANNPNDTGGETYKGISRNNFLNWKGWKLIDQHKSSPAGFEFALKSDATLQRLVEEFYKVEFWDALQLDKITDQKIAVELFDTGVNMGRPVAARILQQSLNLNNRGQRDYPDIPVDGKIGPVTIRYTNQHPRPKELFKTLNIYQGARYIEIIKANASQEIFWRSWLSRVTTAY